MAGRSNLDSSGDLDDSIPQRRRKIRAMRLSSSSEEEDVAVGDDLGTGREEEEEDDSFESAESNVASGGGGGGADDTIPLELNSKSSGTHTPVNSDSEDEDCIIGPSPSIFEKSETSRAGESTDEEICEESQEEAGTSEVSPLPSSSPQVTQPKKVGENSSQLVKTPKESDKTMTSSKARLQVENTSGLGGRVLGILHTSTPVSSNPVPVMNLDFRNLTAIQPQPISSPSSDVRSGEEESLENRHNNYSQSGAWRSRREDSDNSNNSSSSGGGRAGGTSSRPRNVQLDQDVEDMIMTGINNMTLLKDKKGKPPTSSKNQPLVGATCSNYFDTCEEDEAEGIEDELEEGDGSNYSANFDFDGEDSGRGDSDVQAIAKKNSSLKERRNSPSVIQIESSESSGSDDIQIVTEKLKSIPLGRKGVKEQPRKAIFLNELPLPEKKTYSYDPTNVRHQEFYGDVRRTVTELGKTIETMPMPDDESEEEFELPRGLVDLYDHQRYGLRWLLWRESKFPSGGILADEMGLGKTIMIIALIMKSKATSKSKANKENWIDPTEVGNRIPSQTTLVICPVGCILQWSEEIASKGRGLRVILYHGPKRETSAARMAQADVVLTTYSTIASEIKTEVDEDGQERIVGKSPLRRLYWQRIVLDEAHNIRNPKTKSAQGICSLTARFRWAVTGTPVHNRPEDFFSMVKFLKMVPFDDPKVWDFWIGLKKLKASAQDRMNTIGTALILRRTKIEVETAGGNVQTIPPKAVEVIKVEMNDDEKRIYDHLKIFAEQQFQDFLKNRDERQRQLQAAAMTYTANAKKGKKKNNCPDDIKFAHVFTLIMRLRQCAVLPALIKTMLDDEEVDDDDSFDAELEDHLVSKRNPMFNDSYESSKIKRILEDLEGLRDEAEAEERYMDKVVIVSSWTSLLDILYQRLLARKFSCVFITGKENTEERRDAQKSFNKGGRRPQIVLLSLQAGGVGINLVGGNYVFFVEPHWNPQMELQAQDRVHRFGQTKNVYVRRYITEDTIENKVLELQDAKLGLADGVLNSTKKTATGGLSVDQMKLLFNFNM